MAAIHAGFFLKPLELLNIFVRYGILFISEMTATSMLSELQSFSLMLGPVPGGG
jgi:hypothetical protein